jgi:hypothetical protein
MTESGGKPNYALRPDAQAFDEVRIVTVPRYKESELSGDEWRISAEIQLWRKGKRVVTNRYRDVQTALGYAYSLYGTACDEGNGYFAGDGITCDQEGCSEPATVTYQMKQVFCRDGHGTSPHRLTYRRFCASHQTRGDCGLDDADRNYELVQL